MSRLSYESLQNLDHNNVNINSNRTKFDPSLLGNRVKSIRFKKDSMGIIKNDECCICLNGFNETDNGLKILKCGHLYHGKCINEWLKRDMRCPTCRFDVASQEHKK